MASWERQSAVTLTRGWLWTERFFTASEDLFTSSYAVQSSVTWVLPLLLYYDLYVFIIHIMSDNDPHYKGLGHYPTYYSSC